MTHKLGVIGSSGFVGNAIATVLLEKGYDLKLYDKYKHVGSIEDILCVDIVFLCLPTPFVDGFGYDIAAIIETCSFLSERQFKGTVVLKSTVEPGTTRMLFNMFGLKMVHNPEFLSSATAVSDFREQGHIVLGTNTMGSKDDMSVYSMYKDSWPDADFTFGTFEETECCKIFCNVLFASKIQILTEFYLLSQKVGARFDVIKSGILGTGWVNEKHTNIPGSDGKISFGNICFPKDCAALNHFMKRMNSPNMMVNACIEERNKMRKD